jgi:uncharacterized Ntn-hydrolase superfamily protein
VTFSLIGRCARTGQIGAAVTTSSIAVGSRCAFVEAGLGAVLTQHRTDPRLGPRGLALLRSDCTAAEALAALVASTSDGAAAWRQIAVMDATGRTAHYHGARVKPEFGAAHGPDVVAVGNILSSAGVPAAMAAAFAGSDPALPLAERLLLGLEAGEEAGGEHGAVTSAALLVAWREAFPFVDLRVDLSPQPLPALRALWEAYAPLAEGFVGRALDPEGAPVI